MKFKIYFTWPNGTEDSIVISGETIEEIRKKGDRELAKRHAEYQWSQELK